MNLTQPIIAAAIIFFVTACGDNNARKIADPAEYQTFMNTATATNVLARHSDRMEFWQERIARRGGSTIELMKLAGLYAERFKVTGEISDLHASDSLLHQLLKKSPHDNTGIYRALATNATTRHQFKEAKEYLERALEIGDKKAASLLMLADVSLELGDVITAEIILKDFKNKNSFAWLIRQAKVKDQEGQLDSAIVLMEKALKRVESNKSLHCWTKSNLGDYYGHAGRIREAYQSYLEVLALDPDYLYALKGIAWIAFSHDHTVKEAKRILNYLSGIRKTPELYLLEAEIAFYENNQPEGMRLLQQFDEIVSGEEYGEMYNKYRIVLNAEELNNVDIALAIAHREIENRPTTQSYDLLAWSYFHKGETEKALRIVEEKVKDQTAEPEAVYHMGVIYSASHQVEEGNKLLNEALESEFELGPVASATIRRYLKN